MSDTLTRSKTTVFERIWKRPPHFWVQLLCVLLLLVSLQTVLILFVSAGMKYATADNIYDQSFVTELAEMGVFDNTDCILVLGAGLRDDGTPSKVLYDRVHAAYTVYETGDHVLLMSGDRTGTYDEPASMTAAAITMGASTEDIFQDKKGYSTYESVWRLKQIPGIRRIVIVTQRYHLYRAVFIAERMGFEVVGIACDSPTYTTPTGNEVREILARFRDMFRTERDDAVSNEEIPNFSVVRETAGGM
jgi:vancomycin permeability regulator SanA